MDHWEERDHREEVDRPEDMDPLGRQDGQGDLDMEEKDRQNMEDLDPQGHQDRPEEAQAGPELTTG